MNKIVFVVICMNFQMMHSEKLSNDFSLSQQAKLQSASHGTIGFGRPSVMEQNRQYIEKDVVDDDALQKLAQRPMIESCEEQKNYKKKKMNRM